MKHYKQLTREQRYQISGLRKAGGKQVEIAAEVGVAKSTISRELKRNREQRGWWPKQAQALRDKRRQQCSNAKRLLLEDWAEVERLIRLDMSPKQAAARLELEGTLRISHESIYRHIYADKLAGGDLWALRCQKPRRKRYASGQERRGTIKNRVSIDERPEVVGQRIRIGDWEGDTVIGKSHQGGAGDTGGAEIALCPGRPGAQQTCRGCDRKGQQPITPPQAQVPYGDIRQRQRVCGA